MKNVFPSQHPLVAAKLARLRDVNTEPKKFRELVRELAAMLAYEATLDIEVQPITVQTPLATTQGVTLVDKIGLIPILRAGLGMVEGVWELMPAAEVWHIGLYRDEKTLKPVSYYNRLPVAPTVTQCLILDPMLATGGSAVATVDILKDWGVRKIKFVGLIAAPEGIARLHEAHPDVPIHIGHIDDRLNVRYRLSNYVTTETGLIVAAFGQSGGQPYP